MDAVVSTRMPGCFYIHRSRGQIEGITEHTSKKACKSIRWHKNPTDSIGAPPNGPDTYPHRIIQI
jgi:hypothetical protein